MSMRVTELDDIFKKHMEQYAHEKKEKKARFEKAKKCITVKSV